jgi:hypothetical protein
LAAATARFLATRRRRGFTTTSVFWHLYIRVVKLVFEII